MVEGPVEGYMRGKRHVEQTMYELYGEDDSIVVGPSLVYGGRRWGKEGRLYTQFARSGMVKGYLKSMDALRNLSSTPMEDWVEKSLFSPPVEVCALARVVVGVALGLVTRDMLGRRRQGFFGLDGKPVLYADVVYVDGTDEIERIDELMDFSLASSSSSAAAAAAETATAARTSLAWTPPPAKENLGEKIMKEPSWEGALIGKKPFLYPLPVIGVFLALFGAISTNQFINTN